MSIFSVLERVSKLREKSVRQGFLVEYAHQVSEENKNRILETVDSGVVRHCEYSRIDCFVCRKTDICSRIGIIRTMVESQPCWKRSPLE